MKAIHLCEPSAPLTAAFSEQNAHQPHDLPSPEALPPMPYSAGEHAERPWGRWIVLDVMPRSVVKKLTIYPGKRISLQRHRFRSELWTVVDGVADVLCGHQNFQPRPGEQVFIPRGSLHRLSNTTDSPVTVIELQFGHILSEEDIERFDDDFGRQSAEG